MKITHSNNNSFRTFGLIFLNDWLTLLSSLDPCFNVDRKILQWTSFLAREAAIGGNGGGDADGDAEMGDDIENGLGNWVTSQQGCAFTTDVNVRVHSPDIVLSLAHLVHSVNFESTAKVVCLFTYITIFFFVPIHRTFLLLTSANLFSSKLSPMSIIFYMITDLFIHVIK